MRSLFCITDSLLFLFILIPFAHSTVVRDMFLSTTGLNQVTDLIYLDSTRPWALKVFETLILRGSDHQMDASLHGLGKSEDNESQETGGGPQSFSKFYEDLKEACLNWRSKSGMSTEIRQDLGGAYLNIINLFLCVAFLCVSKETDCNSDSANDFEDTSGYDDTASEPLGGRLPFLLPDSVALPSKKQVRRAADMWSICHWMYLESPVFRRQLFRLGGLNVCCRLMTLVLQNLISETKEVKFKNKKENKGKACPPHTDSSALTPIQTALEAIMIGPHETQQLDLNNSVNPGDMEVTQLPAHKLEEEWPSQSIRLLEALLSICLHSSKTESIVSFQVVNLKLLQNNSFYKHHNNSCLHSSNILVY